MSIKAAIIGTGARGQSYAGYAIENPTEIEIVAIAEPKPYLQKHMMESYNIKPENVFKSYEELLAKPPCAEALFICTQDNMHVAPAIMAIKAGYKHIMIEKPIDKDLEQCRILAQIAKEYKAKVQVCHSLRYTPFYRKLKEVLNSGVIGKIMNVNHLEAVGSFHYAHSFVRGDWSKEETGSPMLLAKCCHDTDLLLYLTGKSCKSVSSYGSLSYFKKENAPEGSCDRCINGCKIKDICPYSAMQYFGKYRDHLFRNFAVEKEGFTDTAEAMKKGRYGRCVYHCDNNVVDHQVVSMLFEDGITATLTMCAFSNAGRETRIMGTLGEIYASMEKSIVEVTDFCTESVTAYHINHPDDLHLGADTILVRDFISTISNGTQAFTDIDISIQSHAICSLAEESRLNGEIVEIS